MKVEENLRNKQIELPTPPKPKASYVSFLQSGDLFFVSGHGPVINGVRKFEGRVGESITKEDAYQAARYCALNIVSQLKRALGELDKVEKIVNLHGFVSSADDFYQQPYVVNGASDLLFEVFGADVGGHTRTAIGVNVLPNNIPVEIEVIVKIKRREV